MNIVFDFIIFFILILSGYWIRVIGRTFFYHKDNAEQPKTKIVRITILTAFVIIFLIVFWGSFIEPRLIKVKNVDISLNATPRKESIKIILVSDLHMGPYKKIFFMKKIMKKIDAEKPDLILLTGDFILGKEKNTQYLSPLKNISKKYPTFAVTGNHEFNLGFIGDPHYKDKTATLRKLFDEWGISILDNQTKKILLQKGTINIAGIPDLWTGKTNLEVINNFIDPRYPKILLSHNPDIILNSESENFDLILSGHTHNGQIRLPFLGSLPNPPTKLGRAFDAGLFKLKNGYLYITAGLGEVGPRARLFNPPELTLINLDL